MKKLATTLLTFCSIAATAQTDICINGQWKFFYARHASTADSLVTDGFFTTTYDDSRFDKINVPSCWAVLGYEEPIYRHFSEDQDSEGLYRTVFQAPASFNGKRVLLHFGGVWASAEVWLNGHRLGRHDSGFTSFSFDVSDYIKADNANTLAVRVRQMYPGHETDTFDDWSLGGIFRDVTLEAMPAKRRIDRVQVTTKMTGQVDVRVMVADEHKNTLPGNYLSPGKPYRLRLTMTDSDGRTVAAKDMKIEAHTSHSRETREILSVESPRLWTAETPYLYSLSVELLENDKVVHTRRQKVGIREISTDGGVLRVNGQAVKLCGVNMHDEHPDVGRATRPEHWLRDLQMMKEANINYVRACHYQHAKGFIEMCDSIGMYVGAEVSLGGANRLMYDPAYIGPALLRTYETVVRDINNPSIIYWSVGNEDSFKDMLLQCVRTVKGLDKTRPVLLPWNTYDMLPEEVDILAPHYWTAHEYDSIARTSKRPIITTEYVHAYGHQRFGGLEECFRALTSHPAGAGGAVWMWADQGIRTPVKKDRRKYKSLAKDDDYLRLDAAGWDGITDSYRQPTRDLQEVKAVYCPTRPTIERVAMEDVVHIPIYNGYDFINLNTVMIEWQLFVDGKRKDTGTTRINANPHETATLSLPTSKLGRIKDGQTAYVKLTFTDRNGNETGCRTVEIESTADKLIKSRQSALAIDPSTGLPKGFRPVIWHKLNDGDEIIKNRKGIDLDRYTTRLISSESTTGDDGSVTVHSRVEYIVNDSNRVEASYVCVRHTDGKICVDYELTPHVQTSDIPVVGLAYRTKSTNTLSQWFGKGPEEAYPNKQASPVLGLWDATGMSGIRQMRWADVDDMRIYCDGYLDRDTADSEEVRFLSHVLGRSEKGRLNYPEYHLISGQTYKGSVTIVKR